MKIRIKFKLNQVSDKLKQVSDSGKKYIFHLSSDSPEIRNHFYQCALCFSDMLREI